MNLDVQRFYRACNPSKPLFVGNAEDRQYYMDFSSVRGGKIIEELERTIALLAGDEPICQLFTGHIGCGKSTELLRLKAELEQQKFHVVYFESSQEMDMGDVDITDILLGIARQVSESLEAIQIRLRPGYFTNLFTEIIDFLQTPIDLSVEAELSVGIGKITAKTKDSPRLRHRLRDFLEPRTEGILAAINKDLLEPATKKLRQQGKKELVVIVDNLDRVDNIIRSSLGYTQPEYLFVERGEQLNQLNCHVVYTIPLVLRFSNCFGRLIERFGVPKMLPMVPVRLRQGGVSQEGMQLLQQLVMARAFPTVDVAQQTNLITQVFDHHDTLARLCRISGGHVRQLLRLLRNCIENENPPLSRNCLEDVIRKSRNERLLALTDDEWDLLRQVAQTNNLAGEERYQALIRNMFVFEYRDYEGSWFEINPILAEAPELQL